MTMCKIVTGQWRDRLGLRAHKEEKQAVYVFIGTKYTLSQCRQIARNKGLPAVFQEGTVGSLPNGHHDISLPPDRPIVVVYDVNAYNHSDIFRFFSERTMPQVTIGTYDSSTRMIITQSEVIYDNQH